MVRTWSKQSKRNTHLCRTPLVHSFLGLKHLGHTKTFDQIGSFPPLDSDHLTFSLLLALKYMKIFTLKARLISARRRPQLLRLGLLHLSELSCEEVLLCVRVPDEKQDNKTISIRGKRVILLSLCSESLRIFEDHWLVYCSSQRSALLRSQIA